MSSTTIDDLFDERSRELIAQFDRLQHAVAAALSSVPTAAPVPAAAAGTGGLLLSSASADRVRSLSTQLAAAVELIDALRHEAREAQGSFQRERAAAEAAVSEGRAENKRLAEQTASMKLGYEERICSLLASSTGAASTADGGFFKRKSVELQSEVARLKTLVEQLKRS